MKHYTGVESTLGCFIMHTALHMACCSRIFWHIQKKKKMTHLLGVWNCSNIFIPVLFPFTLTLPRMKNTIIPLYCAAFIVDCFMSVRIHFLLNLSSFTQGHILFCISIPSYLKREHAFHYDFWHDPKCDRNNVIQFWLMQVLTWVRNLAILYTKPSWDIIKSAKERLCGIATSDL